MVELTLGNIVKEYLVRKGENSNHKFMRFLKIAISGLEQMNMDISGVPSYAILDIDDHTLTANLPEDYISYRRICACINGKMIPLALDKNICLAPNYDDCGNEVRCVSCNSLFFPVQCGTCTSITSCSACSGCSTCGTLVSNVLTTVPDSAVLGTTNLHVRNGEQIGGYFGLGGGQRAFGSYIIDTNNARIVFGSVCTFTEVVLEYLASPKKSQGKYVVNPYIKESLIAWMAWQSIAVKDNASQGLVDRRRAEFYNELRKSAIRINASTIDETYQYMRRGFKASPKL